MVGCTYFGVMLVGLERSCWARSRADTGVYAGGWVGGWLVGWVAGWLAVGGVGGVCRK